MFRDKEAGVALLKEWLECYNLPYTDFIATRKAIAERYGLTIHACKARANKHFNRLREQGLPVPVAPATPAGLPFGRRGEAGEGSGGDAVPPCAPPSPAATAPEARRSATMGENSREAKAKPFRFNDGDIKPPVNPQEPRKGYVSCIPLNLLEPGHCAYLKGEPPEASYCNAKVPKEHKSKMLRRNYCAEHAALCVVRLKDRRDDAA